MKKFVIVLLSAMMILSMVGCGNNQTTDDKTIDKLVVSFVPSKDSDVILQAANGDPDKGYRSLAQIIIDGLAQRGFTVNEVEVSVGTSYAAVGEGMVSGTIDIGLIPASTYILYSDGVDLLVEALRYGVADENGNVIDPKDGITPWNTGKTTDAEDMATGYASLIYVNTATDIGADLYAKAVDGQLTWDDVNNATWYVCSSTSSAGYVYPSLWLNTQFGTADSKITVASLSNVIPDGSYANMMESLLTGGCDITVGYADVRKDAASTAAFEAAYPELAQQGKTVWDIIKVIAVSDYIMNDTVSVAKQSVDPKMTPELVKALQEVFIEFGNTEEGQAAVKPYSHKGYIVGSDSDYDSTRAANALFN
ncbi:MAG: PhnD/SsuA/transferrin family substrate-binding protein [Erysipelotrichaceae bacterium]